MTTALTRFEPFAEALRLSDAVEQLLNESWVMPRSLFGGWVGTSRIPLDLYETDEAYMVTALMPGVPSDKVDIQLEQNTLTIRGETTVEQPKDAHYLIQERTSGKIERCIRLPASVDADKISASLKDGVLTIRLPKVEQARPHRITIQTA